MLPQVTVIFRINLVLLSPGTSALLTEIFIEFDRYVKVVLG
jgi:hypothetical protein